MAYRRVEDAPQDAEIIIQKDIDREVISKYNPDDPDQTTALDKFAKGQMRGLCG
jgi:hypothetical protein